MFVSVAEAAVALRIPVNVLREMCERGLIQGAVRFGRIWTVPENYGEGLLNRELNLCSAV